VANNTSSNNPVPNFYRASAADFKKIPGSPIAYWVSERVRQIFDEFPAIGSVANIRAGMATGDNDKHVRLWHEVRRGNLKFDAENAGVVWADRNYKWVPFNKGGAVRKWYGNEDYVLNYSRESYELLKNSGNHCPSEKFYFHECLTWSDVTTGNFYVRYFPRGSVFSTVGNSIFENGIPIYSLICVLATNITSYWLKIINPTLHANPGDVSKIPFTYTSSDEIARRISETGVGISKFDWDSYETSWDFTDLPLLRPTFRRETLAATYAALRAHWREMTLEMQRLEEENNRIFIDAYGLQGELTPDVPLEEITLTCNPHYRYSNNKSEEELETLLLADTMREFISYAVGCMLGRYSLDKPGLILANQGETIEDYLKQVPEPTFMPDADNVIPILDGDWFTDDIVDRFCLFLRTTFGDEHYQENLAFLEDALGKPLRKYFLKDFYKSHVKRYKKRPIYWLFSSSKGSFNALIYMHRYTPDTASIVLNNYLREFRVKLASRREHLEQISISGSASSRDKTAALKEIEKLKKVMEELNTYESEILYPLATQRLEIDLDDGVKVNYSKFGNALKKIKGLSKE